MATVANRHAGGHVGGQACTCKMAGFLPGYSATLTSEESQTRYSDKLKLVDVIDPYEVKKNEWRDDLDLWPAITHA